MKDEELCVGFFDRDEAACQYAYNFVLVYLRKKLFRNNHPYIEDIAGDTMVKIMQKTIGEIKDRHSFKAFLKKTALNAAKDKGKYEGRRRHEPVEVQDEDGATMGENPGIAHGLSNTEAAAELRDTLRILRQALNTLDARCKKLLERYYPAVAMGEELRQVAEALGIPYNNMRVQVVRCKEKLLKNKEYRELYENRHGG